MAHDYRIPHSQFLRWRKDDRDKAIWHYLRERDRCPHCGTRSAEWDEAAGGDRNAYEAALRLCRGCQLRQARQKQLDKGDGPKVSGLYVTLKRPELIPVGGEPS